MENDIVHAYCRMNKMDAIIATKFDKIDFDSFFRFDQGKVFRKKPVWILICIYCILIKLCHITYSDEGSNEVDDKDSWV